MVTLVWCWKQELLELGERIGYVNTGLKEDEIGRCIRKSKPSISNEWSRISSVQADRKCSICQVIFLAYRDLQSLVLLVKCLKSIKTYLWLQEEYEANDDMGKLDCGHGFHIDCIKHWLAHKNTCPVCKAEAVARRWGLENSLIIIPSTWCIDFISSKH